MKDYIGRKFGRLTILSDATPLIGILKNGKTPITLKVNTKCSCGETKILNKHSVLNGNTKSCGCLNRELILERSKARVLDLKKKIFGKLTVLRKIEDPKYRKWECICSCGTISIVLQGNLIKGTTKSCGCWGNERRFTHKMSKTRQHNIWENMIRRCYYKKSDVYHLYGGRGIKVCERWKKFESFWSDMKKGYEKTLTLDRINNDGNYEPSNCRWATNAQQARNKRSNHLILYKEKTQNITDWAIELKIKPSTLFNRILISKWNIEKSLTTPVRKHY